MDATPEQHQSTIAHMLPWPTIGGVEIATLRLIAATREHFRHVAFCMPQTGALQEACRAAGATVCEYRPPEPTLRHFPRFLRESRLVAAELRRQGADLVHCSETKAAYHCSLAALLARVPLITHVRSRFSTVILREKLTFLPVRRFVFVSRDARQGFGMRVPAGKARVLYDGVDTPVAPLHSAGLRSEMGVPPETPLIGMVARVNPQKDYDTLAEAAALVLQKHPEARFVVIGDNSEVELNRKHYAYVAARLQSLGVAHRFFFTGFRTDVPELVEDLDLVVLSTHREGLPLSVLEAMGQGKPVIATAVGGIPEVIKHRQTGLLHAHADARDLAGLLVECLDNPAWARALGERGRQHVRVHFHREAFARNSLALYRELLIAKPG